MELIYIISILLLGAVLWKIHKDDKDHRNVESAKWREHGKRITDVEHRQTEALTGKLELSRQVRDLHQTVRDAIVEVHNLQDHLSRTDESVISVNRHVSTLRPIHLHKTVVPPQPKAEKSRARSKGH